MYAVVMTGGRGTRFWPLSRRDRPKQLLGFVTGKPMLRETLDRLGDLVPPERRCLVVPVDLVAGCREAAPEVSDENVFVEPSGRNTAPCLALAAAELARRDPAAVMCVLPADHHITDPAGFRSTMAAAGAAAEQGALVTLGIRPTRPETGYGYIQRGEEIERHDEHVVHRVERFVEKPDRERAEAYLAGGDYLWNAGIFVWRVDAFLDEVRRQLPDLAAAVDAIVAADGTPEAGAVLAREWSAIQPVSVDVGVMENAREVRVIPSDFGWSDVGSWSSLKDVHPDELGGSTRAERRLSVESEGCVVVAPGKVVATVGVRDLLVVVTDDAVLVCDLDRDQEVREVVARLEKEDLTRYL